MLAALTAIDYGVLALFLASILATGAYFSSRQKDTIEFFLAGRSLGSLPLGLSLAAIFVSLGGFTSLPAAAYDRGWLCWIVVLAFWLVLPVTAFVAIPLYRGLKLVSLYEYLEQRFDFRVRLAASWIFLVWRMLWLVAAIYLPCAAIRWASGWSIPAWTFVVAIGCLATVTAFLGGMRSAAWSGILALIAMGFGAAIAIAGICLNLKGGPERVAEIARGLSRLEPAEFHFEWTDTWALFGALPFWVLTVLTFCLADQVGAQRFLAAKNENLARTGYLICTLALSLLLPALIYLGTGFLAFYYDRPQEMRPEWVVNVDGKTRLNVRGADGQPLLDPANPADSVTFENIDRLVAEGRVLQPNSKEPFTSAAGLVDPDTNRVLIEKLAMRRPNNDRLRGEIIVRQDAPAEMLPHFARQHLSWGMAGIVVAALLASALVAVDATLNSLCTVIVRDLVCPFESGRRWLAQRVGKEQAQLTTTDELQLARPLTLVLGVGATLLAAVFAMSNLPAQGFGRVLSATSTLGAPLLATFLLGMTSRRGTSSAALSSLSCGALVTLGLAIAGQLAAAGVLPEGYQFSPIWPALGGFALTFALGHTLSFVAGRPKSNADLRGLVVGCGELGRRASDEAIPLINIADESAEIRWK